MRTRLLLVSLTILVLLTGCAAKEATGSRDMAESEAMPQQAPRPVVTVVVEKAVEGELMSDDLGRAGSEPMIISTVNMTIVVDDTDEALSAIRAMIASYEGYFAQSNRWISNDQAYARVTMRVPAAVLDPAMETIAGLAIRVEEQNLVGDDVTEEYVNIQARLRTLQATEEELLALLTEVRESRGKAEDILAVHRELTSIRSQIESLQGRSQYLEQMTAMATIHLEIRPKQAPRPVIEKAKWNPLVTANSALRGFVTVFQGLLDLVIYLLIFSPFVLVPALLLWLLVRTIRRRRR